MESNNSYVITVASDWHRVACIAYFVMSHLIIDEIIVNYSEWH